MIRERKSRTFIHAMRDRQPESEGFEPSLQEHWTQTIGSRNLSNWLEQLYLHIELWTIFNSQDVLKHVFVFRHSYGPYTNMGRSESEPTAKMWRQHSLFQIVTIGCITNMNRIVLKYWWLWKVNKNDRKHVIHVEKHASLEKNARSPKFEGTVYRMENHNNHSNHASDKFATIWNVP